MAPDQNQLNLSFEKKREKCIFRYNSRFRVNWDLWIIVFVLYNSVTVPLDISFGDKFESDRLNYVNYCIDCFFFMDIIFNFRTTFINLKTGVEVKEGK